MNMSKCFYFFPFGSVQAGKGAGPEDSWICSGFGAVSCADLKWRDPIIKFWYDILSIYHVSDEYCKILWACPQRCIDMYRFKIDLMLFDSVRFSLFHLYIFLLCFCSVYSPRAKHNGKQLSPFAPRLGRRLGVAMDSISRQGKVEHFETCSCGRWCDAMCTFERYAKYWECITWIYLNLCDMSTIWYSLGYMWAPVGDVQSIHLPRTKLKKTLHLTQVLTGFL